MTTKLTPNQKRAIREERDQQRKQRAALIKKIENCSDDNEMKVLGEQLNELVNVKRSETDYIADHGPKPAPVIKPEVVKLTEPKGESKVAKLTIEKINDYRAQGLKPKDIAKRESINIQSVYQFISANKLTKSRKDHDKKVAKEVTGVTSTDKETKQKPLTEPNWDNVQKSIDEYNASKSNKSDEVRATVQPIQKQRILATIAHPNQIITNQQDSEIYEDTQKRIEGLEATIQHNLKHIEGLQSQLEKLKVFERDYMKLEIDYRNEKAENTRLLDMLEKMKNTKLLNYLLMKDSVGMIEQLDSMVERTTIGEVDNTWR